LAIIFEEQKTSKCNLYV